MPREPETSTGAPLARVPRDRDDDFCERAVAARRELWRAGLGEGARGPRHVEGEPVPFAEARGNVENLVGFAQVPLGLAGPLRVDTSLGLRELYVPMATTEGALVASYSRGMRLLAAAGGARARVVREGLSQHPMLVYTGAAQALEACGRVGGWFEELRELVAGTTRHGALVRVEPEVIGRRLIVRLVFTTGDAIGINMAARAADLVSAELARRTGALERYVHGQDVEKRANARALVEGRGRSVVAEARLPRAALAELARVTPEQLVAIQRSYATGFAQMGTQNWTIQSANGLAAVMIACGQDVAYLTECATGQLDLELDAEGDLFCAVTLPSLLIGTVGGGSGQGSAAECLDLMGCRGDGKGNLFAEVLGATVLAGDLSLMAAFCSQEFVAAHERLGRNRPPAREEQRG